MSKVTFQEVVRFSFAEGNGLTADKSFRLLTLKIEERLRRSEKEFVMSISQDDEPRFVYSLALRRGDYEVVKREQNLDADFDAFPQMVANFVVEMPRTPDSFLRGSLNADNSVFCFEMIGKMGYKWVTILTLNLQLLSDSALISHLVERVLKLKVALREVDSLRDCLAAEHEESERLKASIAELSDSHANRLTKLEAEKNEEIERAKAETAKLLAEIEELNADKQMLGDEVSTLRDEVIDFRNRIDELMESVAEAEEKNRSLSDELTAAEEQLGIAEQRNDELDKELEEREQEAAAKDDELDELRKEFSQLEAANDALSTKVRQLCEERNRWKAEHSKGLQVINKLYREQQKRRASGDGASALEEKVRELEKDLEERKATLDALTESNAQLRSQLDGMTSELAKTKKTAEDWEVKCERKEKMLADLLQMRRSTAVPPAVLSPPSALSSVLPAAYPRVLGVSTLLGNIQTPLRSTACATGSPFANSAPTATAAAALVTQMPPTVPNKL